ncbi:UHRF1BP1L [Cordylochernes scorpioides]|uniref:UHRF1BP1L n=1 Tax=Cordylochernes scorpioides TaxID=51811 RepID=A0ABY6LCJ3_9ARAC|nr:UHRF1BP1L [Cordylochernes scorpioides]
MYQLEYHADTTNPSHPDRPKAMKLQSSRMVATNCRLGDHATRSHLSQCLETLSQSSLIYHTNLFPWEPQDFQPISDTFISHSLDAYNRWGSEVTVLCKNAILEEWQLGVSNKWLCPEAENQVFGDGIWNIHFDPVWVEFLGCEPGRHRPQTFVEPLPVTVWLSWAQPAPEKCSELSVLVHFHSMLNVQLTHHQYLFLLRFMDAYSLLSAHITLDTKAILKETQPLTIGLTTWLSQVEVSLILRSLNQLSATSDSMEPLSLQEDCSSNENLKTTKNLVMQNSFSSHETDNFPPTSPPLSSPQQPANGISPQHSDSSFNSLLPSDKSAVPTPQSAETPPQPTPPPPRPASDSLQRGFHSATSAMKKGLYQIMPSMEAILPPTNDTTAPHDNDDATSLRSDLSSDSDQFVIQGLETSLVGGDDDIFRSSSPAEVELASEVKEDTFSNATTNLSERKRELVSSFFLTLTMDSMDSCLMTPNNTKDAKHQYSLKTATPNNDQDAK